jgi:hypothetical protein
MQEVAKNLIESLTESDLRELMLVMEELAEREGLRHFAKAGTETSIEGSTQNLIDSKADINDTQEALDLKANDSEVVKHSLAGAVSDFLVGAGTSTLTFVKKTLAEVKAILGLGSAAYTSSGDYAVAGKGVTNGDGHDHIGGDGAQVDHGGLGGLSDDDHTQYLRADAVRALSADWDIGNGRMIQADEIRARDGDGLRLFEDGGKGIFIKDGGNVIVADSLGNELVTNGNFADGSSWVVYGGGAITVTDGEAVVGSGTFIMQSLALSVGKFYKVSFDAYRSGTAGIDFGTLSSIWDASINSFFILQYTSLSVSKTSYSYYITPTVAESYIGLREYHGVGGTLYIDNISIKEISNVSSIFEIVSTTKAFTPPRMTSAQKAAIANPIAGMIVYDITLSKLCVYSTTWETLTSA